MQCMYTHRQARSLVLADLLESVVSVQKRRVILRSIRLVLVEHCPALAGAAIESGGVQELLLHACSACARPATQFCATT